MFYVRKGSIQKSYRIKSYRMVKILHFLHTVTIKVIFVVFLNTVIAVGRNKNLINEKNRKNLGYILPKHVGDELNYLCKRKQTNFRTWWRDTGSAPEAGLCTAETRHFRNRCTRITELESILMRE